MHPRHELPQALRNLIRAQAGAVSAEQAGAHGLGRSPLRRMSAGWCKLASGLWIVGEPTWEGFAWASLLRAGPRGVIGGAAACHLHGIVRRPPEQLHLWAPAARGPLELPPFRADYRKGERRGVRTLTRLRVEDAIVDHASEASEFDLVEAMTRALAQGKTTPSRMLHAMEGRRVSKRALLTGLCQPERDGLHSVLEWLFDENVVREHGLPAPSRQVRVSQARVDVYYDGFVVELDGQGFHDTSGDFRRDNRNMLQHHLRTLRYTWHQVMHEPCTVARELAQMLRQCGWEGGVTACGRCRRAHMRGAA